MIRMLRNALTFLRWAFIICHRLETGRWYICRDAPMWVLYLLADTRHEDIARRVRWEIRQRIDLANRAIAIVLSRVDACVAGDTSWSIDELMIQLDQAHAQNAMLSPEAP